MSYLIVDVGVVPLRSLVHERVLFIPDFNEFRPVLAGVFKVVLCGKDREAIEGSEIECAMIACVILGIARIFFRVFVEIIADCSLVDRQTIPLVCLSTPFACPMPQKVRYVDVDLIHFELIGCALLAVGSFQLVELHPWVLQIVVGFVAVPL